ncbi:MAG: hypothetical protein KatS3mg082_0554 [Nitrospiraceae bacterium]|nr:MAG: hypothetical protein KatS3mg082_0554 [Nitrospiraceae bacterium]
MLEIVAAIDGFPYPIEDRKEAATKFEPFSSRSRRLVLAVFENDLRLPQESAQRLARAQKNECGIGDVTANHQFGVGEKLRVGPSGDALARCLAIPETPQQFHGCGIEVREGSLGAAFG